MLALFFFVLRRLEKRSGMFFHLPRLSREVIGDLRIGGSEGPICEAISNRKQLSSLSVFSHGQLLVEALLIVG